jgi:HJR/Mrr/RecB family endonuclease
MVRISAYEWERIEDGFFLGHTPGQWYQIFLAEGDNENLERIRKFYTPPSELLFKGSVAADLEVPQLITSGSILKACIRNHALLLSLNWREFELFTREMLEELGYSNVRVGAGSKDEGVDVTAFIEHALGIEKIIVQCKRHGVPHKVGKPTIKQLLWEIQAQEAGRGLIVTTSTLTRPALLLVQSERHRLGAIDLDEIRRILGKM